MLRGMGPRYPLQPLSEQSLVPTREGWVLGKGTARFPSLAGVQGVEPPAGGVGVEPPHSVGGLGGRERLSSW